MPPDTNNTDSTPCHAADDLHDDTGFLICRGLALVVFVGSVVMYLLL